MSDLFQQSLQEHLETFQNIAMLREDLLLLGTETVQCLQAGRKVILFGNGGSASDAQHIAAELTGRFEIERRALPAIALTTDTSALTAIGNDYGFDRVFSRQVEALAQPGDLVIGISTSGSSLNVIEGLKSAQKKGCILWGFSGKNGGHMNEILCERNLVIPSERTARIQEGHIFLGHTLCGLVDEAFHD